MNTTHLATAFPRIALALDEQRPLLSRPIAEHTSCTWTDTEITLHCADEPTHQLLTSPSVAEFLRSNFELPIVACYNPSAAVLTGQPPPAATRKNNALTFTERVKLQTWMQQPENAHVVGHESDADAARLASEALAPLQITAYNISGMRRMLGIAKVRPAPPPELPLPPDLDLAKLQSQVNEHGTQLDALRIAGIGMMDTIDALRREVAYSIRAHNARTHHADVICPLPAQLG